MWTGQAPPPCIPKLSNKPASLAVPGPAQKVEFTLAIKTKDRYRAASPIGRNRSRASITLWPTGRREEALVNNRVTTR
jgi:hypothetical protein